MTEPVLETSARYEEAQAALGDSRFELTLFVSGASDRSARAITNARELCEAHLHGRYDLTVVDLHEDLSRALDNRVLAAPTLVRQRPLPVRRFVGDLSDVVRVLSALGIATGDPAPIAGV